jgi:hypothetical protein
MATPQYGSIIAQPPPIHRGGTPAEPIQYRMQSCQFTVAWGCEPATASVVYVAGGSPIAVGYSCQMRIAGYTFHGTCKSDVALFGSGGQKRTMEFYDNREYLDWDKCYCSFNHLVDRLVDGKRQKRYAHMLPANFNLQITNWTNEPYTAAQIIAFILGSRTIEDPWTVAYPTAMTTTPVYECDFTGKSVRSALQEISDAVGMVYTLRGQWLLSWCRKGSLLAGEVAPSFPAAGLADNKQDGFSLSGMPTRYRILGDRNQYQVHEIELIPDWKPAWEALIDEPKFIGTVLDAMAQPPVAGDPEGIINGQNATAKALKITVREYAALVGNSALLDPRLIEGRPRNDMPAALYVREILFRAFRFKDDFAITNADGLQIPISALRVAEKMVAEVEHDPATGDMTYDETKASEGNGYAIAQGYQVGTDMFRTINPDRFDFAKWVDGQTLWEHVCFQIDDGGNIEAGGVPVGSRYTILFDTQVIKSNNLMLMVDGYGVFRTNPTIEVPSVKIALTFEAEKFSYIKGPGTKDECETVGGLYAQIVVPPDGSAMFEVPYSDGFYASEKAEVLADSLLDTQFTYQKGSWTGYPKPNASGVFPAGTALNGLIDRISLEVSPRGCMETIEFASERPRINFVPERDLDRNAKAKTLFAGQKELQYESKMATLRAASLRSSPEQLQNVTKAYLAQTANHKVVIT